MPATKRAVFEVEGLNDVLRAFRTMDKEGNAELRRTVQGITDKHAQALRQAGARNADPRVRQVSQTTRAARDRVPTVQVGGARRIQVSRGGTPPTAGDLVFGTEFGAEAGGANAWRFPAATTSIWLFATLKGRQREVLADWEKAVDQVVEKWSKNY